MKIRLISLSVLSLLSSPLLASAAPSGAYIRIPIYQGGEMTGGSALPSDSLSITLNPHSLTNARVGEPYLFDFSSIFSVAGAESYNTEDVSWSLKQDAVLPLGLSFSSAGILSGTPAQKSLSGASFEVVASYLGKTGENGYTIIVNGKKMRVSQMVSGGWHTCALTMEGGVKCWGSNSSGQLGSGAQTNSLDPVDVEGLQSNITRISAGQNHTCALTNAGAALCWGHNFYGQIGDASNEIALTPKPVSTLTSKVSQIAAGYDHTCAVHDGAAKCWGSAQMSKLGNNSTTNRNAPVTASGLSTGVIGIAAGQFHSCAIVTGGGVKCWGDNYYYQVGDSTRTQRNTPVNVPGLSAGVSALDAGYYHTCARMSAGDIRCWGRNNHGQIGDGSLSNATTPASIDIGDPVKSVTAKGYHSCAVTTAGAVKCWGRNSEGQVGDESLTRRESPTPVSGLSEGVAEVSAGNAMACAVLEDGTAKCWGQNTFGQIGDSTMTLRPGPVDVVE